MTQSFRSGSESRPADVDGFIAMLRALDTHPHGSLRQFFSGEKPAVVARAPGRLDVMGGIADYSGSLVLQLPLAEATYACAQRSDDDDLRVVTLDPHDRESFREVVIAGSRLRSLADDGYDAARDSFRDDPETAWAAYVLGTIVVLALEKKVPVETGLRILIDSRVPEGKGVSSSAALEVATLEAVSRLLGVTLDGAELARLCQTCENHVVGAPCGIMDQMTSALGKADRLLALLCQPAEIQGFVEIPPGVAFWGIDSGVRHAVSGADYTSVRVGAFMGYRIIAGLAGLEVKGTAGDGKVEVADPGWGGYLANLTPGEFAGAYSSRIPERMQGREFLERYGGLTDPVTRVDPSREYAVRRPTAHPIEENDRVRRFAELLARADEEEARIELGTLMYRSHESYSACGLGVEATDRIVAAVREAGPGAGLYGAKITGGGSGGTVAVLGRADVGSVVAEVAQRCARESGCPVVLFQGSSPGAREFGAIDVERLAEV